MYFKWINDVVRIFLGENVLCCFLRVFFYCSRFCILGLQLSLVGKVVRAEHQHLSFNVMLDDGTGTIECKHFMTSTDDAGRNLEEQRLAEIQQGMYVRVFGHLSKSMGTPSITAFAIRPVTDFNEVTYHLAQIIFQHMHLTKGIDQHSGAGDALAAAAPGMEAFGQGQDGFTPVQQQILEAFRSPQAQNSVQGFAVDDVMGFTSNRFPVDQVLQAIAFLVEEGHLYSTTDDAHWKAC